MDYSLLDIKQLKALGHKLLDEYVSLDRQNKGKSHAYKKLALKLDRENRKHHFAEMKTRMEVIQAIAAIRKMIKARKSKNEWLDCVEILPQDKMKEALAQLKNGRD